MDWKDELVSLCLRRGWKCSTKKHPKTALRWENDWQPHDTSTSEALLSKHGISTIFG